MVGNASAAAGLADKSNGAANGQLPVYNPGDKVLCEATFEQAGRASRSVSSPMPAGFVSCASV